MIAITIHYNKAENHTIFLQGGLDHAVQQVGYVKRGEQRALISQDRSRTISMDRESAGEEITFSTVELENFRVN